jgi:hypothetical protein
MISDFRERTVDVAIALSLTAFPLLPTGPSYLGFHWPWALEVFFLLFVLAGTPFLLVSRAHAAIPSSDSSDAARCRYSVASRGFLSWGSGVWERALGR